jgi:hypothetical protein
MKAASIVSLAVLLCSLGLAVPLAANPIAVERQGARVLTSEELLVEVGAEQCQISGTFIFELSRWFDEHQPHFWIVPEGGESIGMPVYVPTSWTDDEVLRRTKMEIKFQGQAIPSHLRRQPLESYDMAAPDRLSKTCPEGFSLVWFMAWRPDDTSGTHTIEVSYSQQNADQGGAKLAVYTPLLPVAASELKSSSSNRRQGQSYRVTTLPLAAPAVQSQPVYRTAIGWSYRIVLKPQGDVRLQLLCQHFNPPQQSRGAITIYPGDFETIRVRVERPPAAEEKKAQ